MKKEIEKIKESKEEKIISVHRIYDKFIVFTDKAIYEEIPDGNFKKKVSNYGKWDEF